LLVLLAQAAGAQSSEDGRNAPDLQRGATRDLGPSQGDGERDLSKPVLRRIVMPSRLGLSPSELSEDSVPGPDEPALPRTVTATDPGLSPSEISEANDSARDPTEPFLPQAVTGSDRSPSPSEPRQTDNGAGEPFSQRAVTRSDSGLSPSEISEGDDSARDALEPRLPRMITGSDPGLVPSADSLPATVAPLPTGPREELATKHARYVPVSWEELPGWREGATLEAWSAFAQGCAVLSRRPAWRETCDRASVLRPATAAAAREFFEREFEAFQIQTVDRADTGTLTGYYEVALEGSRVRTARFRHPVYAVPEDLLFLDARLLTSRRPPAYVRLEGRDVVPVADTISPALRNGDAKVYRLAISAIPASLRDGKIRVRRSGDRIVPYFTRQEIERNGLSAARPIAWVDDADLLYALHIEGSGRIRLGDGEILRVAFGEQNGHRFRPTLSSPSGSAALQRVVDFFIPPAAALESTATVMTPDPAYPRPPSEGPRVVVSSASDPSYIFFRQIPNNGAGPPGAMGVPLTAGSSLAVDPRVTPLGAPVFIAARQSGSGDTIKRLTVAQDTGGAIRGAVRADFFLGFGPAAGTSALRMKDELRMWLLLPKQLVIASKHAASASGSGGPNCLLPDQEFCND